MQYSYCKLLVGCLVLQVAVDATVVVSSQTYVAARNSFMYMDVTVATFSNRDATIIPSSIRGQLEFAAPSDACSPIAHPLFEKTYTEGNLVLINGTDKCDFITKIKNARTAGFEAAILFDPFPEPFNYSDITFPIERSEVDVTVVLVSCEDGIKLQNHIFPESKKENKSVWIISTSTHLLNVILLSVFMFAVVVLVLFLLRISCRDPPLPVSGVSESTPLLASGSSAPNHWPRKS